MVSTRSKPTSQNPQIGPQTVLNRPLENFKAAVLRVAADNLVRQLTAAEVSRIEEGIVGKSHFLSHTPDHPPYAAMICQALLELNEEGGSSEESISDFMKKEFPDLPWAHSAYLKHHLCKLCTRQEIYVNSDNLYLLVDENIPNSASVKKNKPKSEPRKKRGRPSKNQNKAKEKESTSGLGIVVREEQNELTEEKNEAVESGRHEHKPTRIKLQLSKNKPTIDTIVSALPLAVVEGDQNVLDCSVLGASSKTPLDLIENSKKNQERQMKPAYRNKKPEATSTTALILNLAQPNNQPHGKVKCRGRGRPRKNESFGEREDENIQDQQQPRRRGRPRKEREGENFQMRQQPSRMGRPGKLDS